MNETLFSILSRNMGWTPEYLRSINETGHSMLKDVDVLCEKLHEIRTSGEQLVIYPDIDTDGLTSGSLGLAGFAELGFNVSLYIPDAAKGHGVYVEDIDAIVEQFPDVKAIVTCDTGITSFDGIVAAQNKGLQIFVTDHHQETPKADGQRLPADVVINPMRIDETYEHPAICGAFVLYQVIEEYTRRYAPHQLGSIMLLKVYAGIGTIADVMPILYENREIVRETVGLLRLFYLEPEEYVDMNKRETKLRTPDVDSSIMMQIILSDTHHEFFVRAFRGLGNIVAAYIERGSVRSRESLDEGFAAFYIAPAINAVRRVKEDISIGFGAFTATNSRECADYLLLINERRKKEQAEAIAKLAESSQPLAPYIYTINDVPGGMLGLLANAMMNESGVPTLVLSERYDGSYGGSGRSPMWYPFNSKLNEFGFWAQGHEQAFGARMGSWDDLCTAYELIAADSANVAQELREAGVAVDIPEADLILGDHENAHAPLDDLEALLALSEQLHMLKPFGHMFRAPVIDIISDARTVSTRTMGKESQHIALSNTDGMKMIMWNRAVVADNLKKGIEAFDEKFGASARIYLHALGDVERNEWRDVVSANLMTDTFYLEVVTPDGEKEKILL